MEHYNEDYFIAKFEAIPESEWILHEQQNDAGQRCAFGHCLPESHKQLGSRYWRQGLLGHQTEEGTALAYLFDFINVNVAIVNNGEDPRYQQSTPKRRILAALRDIRRMQEQEIVEEKPESKPTTQYKVVRVSETIYDQELITSN